MQNKTHTIRSYVKREQRMTVGQERALSVNGRSTVWILRPVISIFRRSVF